MAIDRIPDRARQHGRAEGAGATRCGARRRSAPSRTSRSAGRPMPRGFIRALALIKAAAAHAPTRGSGLLEADVAEAIVAAAHEVADGRHDAQFPVDVFQTGSGTSTNMNANEVIARLATAAPGPRGAPQRPRQHGPEQQRRDPDGDPRQRRAGRARERCCRRSQHLAATHRAQGSRARRTWSRPAART